MAQRDFQKILSERVWLVVLLLAALPAARGAEDDEEELPVYLPGLVARYSEDSAGAATVTRIDDDLLFVWPRGESPDSRLAAGPFSAAWSGRLHTLAGGEYRLHVYLQGRVAIRINDQSVLDVDSPVAVWHESAPIKLAYGHHPLAVTYTRGDGDGELKLCWSGPQFGIEPIPERHLFHDPSQKLTTQYAEGELLVRALRCAACHDVPGESKALPAPALTHLKGNLSSDWLVDWLTAGGGDPLKRRMPHQGLSADEAADIAAYLFDASQASAAVDVPRAKEPPPVESDAATDAKKKPKPRKGPSIRAGEQLTRSVGCVACHRVGELGGDGLFGGTDLTAVADKRPPEFFVRWLTDASRVNADHRMPQFKLESLERDDLAVYLMTLGTKEEPHDADQKTGDAARGKTLVAEHRCAACHKLPGEQAIADRAKPLTASSNWNDGCLDEPNAAQSGRKRPGYRLDDARRKAIVEYLSAKRPDERKVAPSDDGRFVLAERNCLSCHARGHGTGLAERVSAAAAADAELQPLEPALLPPSLTGVGDKLPDAAFLAAIKTDRPPIRPWLRARMPKFNLSDDETSALQRHVVDHDRVPDLPAPSAPSSDDVAQRLAARRLVTADGFGCTSCHKIGETVPSGTLKLASMGSDLTMIGDRIRKPWFDRWVRNPARIIPRMEMPSVKLAVQGVLHDDIDEQLAAVWKVLNEPGFNPPQPNPVRIVRSRNVPGVEEPPHVLTDVFVVDGETYVSPIVIGLPNRHNVLFDLEHNRLAAWWTGDTALERTKGKSWYWEPGGAMVPRREIQLDPEREPRWIGAKSELTDTSFAHGENYPIDIGQNSACLDVIRRGSNDVTFEYRMQFRSETKADELWVTRRVTQSVSPIKNGFRRRWEIASNGNNRIDFYLHVWKLTGVETSAEGREAIARDVAGKPRFVLRTPGQLYARGDDVGVKFEAKADNPTVCEIDYLVDLPIDTFPNELPAFPTPPATRLDVVPGYMATRLPLPANEMPTGLAWTPGGSLVFSSLKGRVFAARDTDGDGLEDVMAPLSDDLATPYGLQVAEQDHREVIDVITKPALMRLHDDDGDGFFERQEVVADGWGHTDDYHDWAVGLPKTGDGGYYVALPCQQDDRDPAKALLRGQGLKLIPRAPTEADPRRFRVEPFCGGLRFPMGLAVDRRGRLFATDNQGNYNPFNELNHLQPDKRYGFINKLEREPGFNPPVESPAVEIPHPWTRSVNGICFLDTPAELRKKTGRDHFGPFEGHLIGCEFNNRILVRMSLEEVDGVMQGAAYPFSIQPTQPYAPTFEGPNVVEVAPDGDIYVGSLLDSGWGGGQNTGSLIRIVPQADVPPGIAEVRAARDGFVIRFTQPITADALADKANYSIEKYRRESTPQYGGDDLDRGLVKIAAVEPSADRREVRLKLDGLTAGFVYEFHLANLTAGDASFFPAEAHYTLKRAPQ